MTDNLIPLASAPMMTNPLLGKTLRLIPMHGVERTETMPSPKSRISSIDSIFSLPDEGKSLDDDIKDLGFEIEEKILTVDDIGNVLVKYMKIKSPHGGYAMIDLDTADFIAIEPDNPLFMSRMSVGDPSDTSYPKEYELKYKNVEWIYPQKNDQYITGIAYECNNGVCVLHRSKILPGKIASPRRHIQLSPGRVTEKEVKDYLIKVIDEPNEDDFILSGATSVAPVIRYSTLKSDPQGSMKSMIQFNRQSKNKILNDFDEGHATLTTDILNLCDSFKQLNTSKMQDIADLEGITTKLETYQEAYAKKQSLTSSEMEKYNGVVSLLNEKYSHLHSLSDINYRMTMISEKLRPIIQEINEITLKLKFQ
ncbi:hypothetical protein D3C87_1176400 [compost metagenome]